MYFNKINYKDDYSIITYDACKVIWDNRGYLLKKEQTSDNKRIPYRRIYSDTAITKLDTGPYGPCLAIVNIGWSNSSRSYRTQPVLVYVYPDKIVVNNIAKHYFGDRDSTQKNYSHWGFQRMLTRLGYLCNQRWVERNTKSAKVLDKDGKNVNDVLYSFAFSQSILLTNKYDSPNHITMTITSDIQDNMISTCSSRYHSYGRRKYTAFLESGADSKSVSESRSSITSLGLLREYTLNYVSSLLQNEHNKQNLTDWSSYAESPYANNNNYNDCKVPADIDEHMRYFDNIGYGVCTGQKSDESARASHIKKVEKNNLVRSSTHKMAWPERTTPGEMPVALTYLYPQIVTSRLNETNTFNEYMTQDCISDTMGFGLSKALKDKSPDSPTYLPSKSHSFTSPLARVNFTKIRALSGSRSIVNSCNMIPGSFSDIHPAGSGYRQRNEEGMPGLGTTDAGTQDQIESFVSHMIQMCLCSKSVMYRKAMGNLHFPLGILINAVLVEASNYPDHYDFILEQYFGKEALGALKKSSYINFKHPIHSSFLAEGTVSDKGRNILEDTIKLMSGTGVLHYLVNENSSCKSFAIEAACGYRVVLDHGAYAEGIPIYVCNTGNPTLDNYEEQYHLALYNFQKTFLGDSEFVGHLDSHLKESFSWFREGQKYSNKTHTVSYVDAFSDKCKSSISMYSQVIYNYLKKAIYKANSSGCLISSNMLRGFKHVGGVTGNKINHFDLTLRSNLKVNPIRSMHKEIKFIEELESSLS